MIRAECHSDDHVIEIEFDATGYFGNATDGAIIELADCGWGGDYPGDEVAEYYEHAATKDLFDYIAITQRQDSRTRPAVGFECYVDESSARYWLTNNRPEIAGYLDYLDAKTEIEEEPLTLKQWREFNKSADEPEEIGFGEHRPE